MAVSIDVPASVHMGVALGLPRWVRSVRQLGTSFGPCARPRTREESPAGGDCEGGGGRLCYARAYGGRTAEQIRGDA